MSAVVRALEAGDLAAVKGVIDANDLFPSDLMNAMVAPHLAGRAAEAWLTADEGGSGDGPVAVLCCAPERMTDATRNNLLAVHPGRHEADIGTAPMREVERRLAGRGARVLLVEASGLDAFAPARRFYDRVGYEEAARTRDFYAAGEDKAVSRKAL